MASVTCKRRVTGRPARRGGRPRSARRGSPLASLMVLVIGLTAVGLGRVAIAVDAAEACLDAGRLAKEIKSERQITDRLEIDRSALSTPSRLQVIAGEAMSMAEPEEVRFILADELATDPAAVEASADGPGAAILEALAKAAAAQARVLLVGGVGLSAAR